MKIEKTTPKSRLIIGISILVVLVLGVGIGVMWDRRAGTISKVSDCKEGLVDPAVCSGEPSNKVSFDSFRKDLEDHHASAKQNGAIESASIFFRDLRNGPQIVLNVDETYAPMSLMKMPLMVAILKYAESHPGVLEEKIHTPMGFATNVQIMNSAQTLLPNHDYTIEEMLIFMISYSDNRALGMLGEWFDKRAGRDSVEDTLVGLGLMRRQDIAPATVILARTYGAILRILYGAAYLNLESSQKALDFLTKTEFKDGLTHDVPDGVRVAHKFGVLDDGTGEVQLHDCGITYHPSGPYVLCVMTRGKNYERQARYIQDVASRVYQRVGSQAGE